MKSTIFKKNEDKNTYLMKSKISYEDSKETEQMTLKSKSNLLNLSILKHL